MVGNNIKKFRKRNNMSLRELADKLGISHTSIAKYENNEMMPSSATLIKLSKIFNIKVAELFKKVQQELVIKDIHYRKLSTFSKRNQEIVEDITKDNIRKYLEVINLFSDDRFYKVNLNELTFEINSYEEIEEKVIELREKLNLGIDPISNLLELLEELGFIIIFVNPIKGFDGKEGLVNGKPFIVLANDKPGDRQRYSLAHELGHVIAKFDGLEDEKVANYFAGAFLIPKVSLIKDLGVNRNTLTIFELENLKKKYKVSMQSIVYRAWQVNIISEYEKTRLFKRFSQLGYRKDEPVDIPREQSHKFEQMLCEAVSEGYLSQSKAAEYLNIKTSEFIIKYMGQSINDYN